MEELKRLVDTCQQLISSVTVVIEVLDDPMMDMIQENIAHRLDNIRKLVSMFTRDLSRHQRTPASHIFVMMISSEQRNVCHIAASISK